MVSFFTTNSKKLWRRNGEVLLIYSDMGMKSALCEDMMKFV